MTDIFVCDYFHSWTPEPTDMKPTDRGGWLYLFPFNPTVKKLWAPRDRENLFSYVGTLHPIPMPLQTLRQSSYCLNVCRVWFYFEIVNCIFFLFLSPPFSLIQEVHVALNFTASEKNGGPCEAAHHHCLKSKLLGEGRKLGVVNEEWDS